MFHGVGHPWCDDVLTDNTPHVGEQASDHNRTEVPTPGRSVCIWFLGGEEMKAGKNGQAVINEFGTKKGWDGFTEGLEAEFTPLKSLEIAKANAEIKKLNAEAKFKNDESRLKMTLEETKSWGDHTQTDLFKQLATKSAQEFKETTGFDTMDEYAKDYIARMRTATGATDYTGWSSTETTPK